MTDPSLRKWMDQANRINSGMQEEAHGLAKKTALVVTNMHIDNQLFLLNSYAFYGRNLVQTLSRYLPAAIDRTKIEDLFIDHNYDTKPEFV